MNRAARVLGRKLLPSLAAERAVIYERGVRKRRGVPGVAHDTTSRLGRVVMAGPFEGMLLPDDLEENVACPVVKLLGQYERCVHQAIEEAIAGQPTLVVNVGSADGYYAVGLARRLPGATVFAHDLSRTARAATANLARLNGVGDSVRVSGRLRRFPAGPILVVCDIEGGEDTLLDPRELELATIVVETHDYAVPGVTQRLQERFSGSHNVERLDEVFPESSALAWMSPGSREIALDEMRVRDQNWLVMRPRL